MTIFAAHTAASTHPSWCAADIPSHISAEQVVVATSGPEIAEIYVSLEQETGPGSEPAVRIQGATDAPMTPAQALELAYALTVHAFTAATAWAEMAR